MLVGHAQHFLAGDEETIVGGCGDGGTDERRHAVEDVLAVVQYEQQTTFGDHRQDGLRGVPAVADLHAERSCHGRRHERVVGKGREFDPADAAWKLGAPRSGDGLREARLADPARAGDGDRPVGREQGLDAGHVVVATVERAARVRQIRRRPKFPRYAGGGFRRSCRCRAASRCTPVARTRRFALDGQREAVTPPGHRRDRLVPEQFAQRDDLHLEVVLLDHEARPHDIQQLVLRDRPVPALDECEQGVERPAAELDRLVVDRQ